jgi:hypothetical protein
VSPNSTEKKRGDANKMSALILAASPAYSSLGLFRSN